MLFVTPFIAHVALASLPHEHAVHFAYSVTVPPFVVVRLFAVVVPAAYVVPVPPLFVFQPPNV